MAQLLPHIQDLRVSAHLGRLRKVSEALLGLAPREPMSGVWAV